MFDYIFGDHFDFNNDGTMDEFEKRAEYMAILDEVRMSEGIEKELDDMDFDELNELSSLSGIDPGWTGF